MMMMILVTVMFSSAKAEDLIYMLERKKHSTSPEIEILEIRMADKLS